jgi:hypothetical protein
MSEPMDGNAMIAHLMTRFRFSHSEAIDTVQAAARDGVWRAAIQPLEVVRQGSGQLARYMLVQYEEGDR